MAKDKFNEEKILVLYIGVAGIRSEDIEEYCFRVTKKVFPETFKGETIVIPIQSPNTKVECINPKYITDVNLIKEHTEKMKKLEIELQFQLENLKKENNG